MLKEILVLLSICFTVSVARTQCRHDSECGTGECCYYHEGPMIASKKRDLLSFNPVFVQGGWCEKYGLEGEGCSVFGKANGHCGCAPGLSCKLIKDPTIAVHVPTIISTINKRSMIFGGHSECRP